MPTNESKARLSSSAYQYGPPAEPGNGEQLLNLLPNHLADLRRSGLSNDMIRTCQFRSVTDPKQVAELLNWRAPAKSLGSCLCFPYPGRDGVLNGYCRLKPSRPRRHKQDGKPIKYEAPVGLPNHAYFPPGIDVALNDPTALLLITEGEKKAIKAI